MLGCPGQLVLIVYWSLSTLYRQFATVGWRPFAPLPTSQILEESLPAYPESSVSPALAQGAGRYRSEADSQLVASIAAGREPAVFEHHIQYKQHEHDRTDQDRGGCTSIGLTRSECENP